MGRFADFNIKDNAENANVSQSDSGGHNVQNTQVVNNRTINNHYKKPNDNDNEDESVFIAGAVILIIGIGFIIWSFFAHYDGIYLILKSGALFSPVFSVFGIIALIFREEAEMVDVVIFLFILLAGCAAFS
jgi:hypothetical protein